MKLSRETLEALNQVDILQKELVLAIDLLAEKLKKDTNNKLTVASPFGVTHPVHLVNLSHISELTVINRLADESTIQQKWKDADKRCYGFSIEGIDCIMLASLNNDE